MGPRVAIAERGRPLGSPLSVWLSFRAVPFLVAGLSKLWSYTLRVRREGFEAVEDLVARDERFILAMLIDADARLLHQPHAAVGWRR